MSKKSLFTSILPANRKREGRPLKSIEDPYLLAHIVILSESFELHSIFVRISRPYNYLVRRNESFRLQIMNSLIVRTEEEFGGDLVKFQVPGIGFHNVNDEPAQYYKSRFKLRKDGFLDVIEVGYWWFASPVLKYSISYYKEGKRHRGNDKPAYIDNLIQAWFKQGKYHREGGNPAFMQAIPCWSTRTHMVVVIGYFENGKLHRLNDEPAYICSDIRGQEINHKECGLLTTLTAKGLDYVKAYLRREQRHRRVFLEKVWSVNNVVHRDNELPAAYLSDETQFFFDKGRLKKIRFPNNTEISGENLNLDFFIAKDALKKTRKNKIDQDYG